MKQDFYNTLSKKNKVLKSYDKLIFSPNNSDIYICKNQPNNYTKKTINISLFPSYIKPVFSNTDNVKIIEIPQKKITGYAVLIKNNPDINTLFKTEFKKSFRANILRFVNRFESCFNANYQMFYGDISTENYTFLMTSLHGMLTNRFNQRNDTNKILQNWGEYFAETYSLIKSNKASLFVIYHNTTPVHICINHHFDKILFVSVPSYDINYAKFALGNISLYKLLEWSIQNNYEIMDMAYGYLEYKRRWSNYVYEFKHHVIYPKSNISASMVAFIEVNKTKFKNFLKSKNLDTFIEKSKKILNKQKPLKDDLEFIVEDSNSTNFNSKEILENTKTFNLLRKSINDFLFINKEHINNLKVYEVKQSKEYLLIGKQVQQKLILNKIE